MKNHWNYRTSIIQKDFDHLSSSRWDCPYIIRLGFNGSCVIYDTRRYSNMKAIDFNYFNYSVISKHLCQKQAKRKIAMLMRKEDNARI